MGKKEENTRREWFEFYIKELSISDDINYNSIDGYYFCPCCNFPTLSDRGAYEICFLCDWEDDGQDNHNADKVLGGPNSDYSLTEARANFVDYLTSYRPSDVRAFRLSNRKKIFFGLLTADLISLKKKIISKFHLLLKEKDKQKRSKIFNVISKLEKKLR